MGKIVRFMTLSLSVLMLTLSIKIPVQAWNELEITAVEERDEEGNVVRTTYTVHSDPFQTMLLFLGLCIIALCAKTDINIGSDKKEDDSEDKEAKDRSTDRRTRPR